MKHIIIFFVFVFSLSAFSQVNYLADGDTCFSNGNYACALTKYKEKYKTANESEKLDIEIKIQQAKWCIENLKNADLAFKNNNYNKAKEYYLAVLDSNPNDDKSKKQIEIINNLLLKKVVDSKKSLSKTELFFKSNGGNETINVGVNSKVYSVNLLPSWCTVEKYDNYFIIFCNKNNQTTKRTDYFNVKINNQTIRINLTQEGYSNKDNINVISNFLQLSRTDLFFLSNNTKQEELIYVSTNAIDFELTLVPAWCRVNKFKSYISITCEKNNSKLSRKDWFKVTANGIEVIVNVNQSAGTKFKLFNTNNGPTNFDSFSSIGIQSGEIARYGFIYERGGRKTVGFRVSGRTSLTPEQDIINGTIKKNKTEIELGPNFRLTNRLYFNLGLGYGFYNKIINNDYSGSVFVEKKGYSVASTGVMFRVSKKININIGLSFMDIEKEIYTPEITFGASYNLNKNNTNSSYSYSKGQVSNTKREKNRISNYSSFSSLGFYGGKNAKYGLFYESGGNSTTGFHISARTSLKEEKIVNGQLILNRSELELGPNFKLTNQFYLNLGIGYGIYDYGFSEDNYQGTVEYFTANTGVVFRVSEVINLNTALYFENFDIDFNSPEITFGISFNLWD
jgi:hypothetical protein